MTQVGAVQRIQWILMKMTQKQSLRQTVPSRSTARCPAAKGVPVLVLVVQAGQWCGSPRRHPRAAADEQLVVVVTEEAEQPFCGGLLTTKQQHTQVLSSRDVRKEQDEDKDDSALWETVYRDALGQKIDMKAEKVEVARKKRDTRSARRREM
jgi:hypothetical protein